MCNSYLLWDIRQSGRRAKETVWEPPPYRLGDTVANEPGKRRPRAMIGWTRPALAGMIAVAVALPFLI